jgi:uncharacterized protein (DUF1501 family)
MPTRREFIKQGVGAVTVGLVLPKLRLAQALAQSSSSRKILVIIQLEGGNDGLNTVIPYTDSRYYQLRPTLSFRDSELKDEKGRPLIISSEFGLHPNLGEIKDLFDQGKVAIIQGVGYPNPNLSHFFSMDIWHTANTTGQGEGWLGRYADLALVGQPGLPAASIGSQLPRTFYADQVVIPNITSFSAYTFLTDSRYPGDRNNQLNAFNRAYRASFQAGSFLEAIADTGLDAVEGAQRIQASISTYSSRVSYPANNPLAAGMKMLAQIITTIPEARLLYARMGGFDTHATQIGSQADPNNKLVGQHATLLNYFSEAVKAFYDDMVEHGLAQNVVMMQWSEFGRRPAENASRGTDHGTTSVMFVIGDPVRGGLYGQYASLSNLDSAGNPRFTVDFRAVYATILDRWLGADSLRILGAQYENLGFLG